MATYGSSATPQLNQVPEDIEASQLTPSHGGVIGGHEFDQSTSQTASSTQPLPSNTPTSPVPRGTLPFNNKPRPVSMPPQPYAAALAAANTQATGSATTTSSDTKDRSRMPSNDTNTTHPRRQNREGSSGTRQSRSNRILGDYTLSKTLGAGSMGKVKLATHNITGEKVRSSLS